MRMYGLKHLLLIEVLLMHEVSELFVMILQHLHRRTVDCLLLHRVAGVVDVVRVMMMNI